MTPDQYLQLATPSYKLKKEKREAKKLEVSTTPSEEGDTLVDQSSVSVLVAIDDQGSVKSPTVAPPEKKVKIEKPTTSKAMKSVESRATTDTKIVELDQKWSDLID